MIMDVPTFLGFAFYSDFPPVAVDDFFFCAIATEEFPAEIGSVGVAR
jgi:hypothetical protein